MKKLLGLIFLLLVAAGAAAGVMYMRVNQPYRGYEGAEQFVDIPTGAGSIAIGDRLIDAGVIRDRSTYRTAVWMSGKGRQLKAGEYRFDRAMTPFEVIDKVARGDVFVVHVTFREGLTMAEMAKIFESEGLGTAAAFISRLKTRTSLTVDTEDERLSSREAESRLAVHERDWRERKKKLDAAAAAVILQDYLDRG